MNTQSFKLFQRLPWRGRPPGDLARLSPDGPADAEAADPDTPPAEEFLPVIPGLALFAVAERTVIEVSCPYCDSAHRHLLHQKPGRRPARPKPRGRTGGTVYEFGCGWGKYCVEPDTACAATA